MARVHLRRDPRSGAGSVVASRPPSVGRHSVAEPRAPGGPAEEAKPSTCISTAPPLVSIGVALRPSDHRSRGPLLGRPDLSPLIGEIDSN